MPQSSPFSKIVNSRGRSLKALDSLRSLPRQEADLFECFTKPEGIILQIIQSFQEEMVMIKRILTIGIVTLTMTLFASVVMAEYPEKAVTYIIPFNPGGESDITARLQEPVLEKILGTAVNVTHKPGGGGAVAWSEFQRRAKPDGYTFIGVNIPHIVAQPILRKGAGSRRSGRPDSSISTGRASTACTG